MNSLAIISNTELDKRIEEIKDRELSLQTERGRTYLVGKMRELIGLLETWGYKFDGSEDGLAMLWANGLSEEFVKLGADGMRQAVANWATEDTSEYRSFPKIPWIKEACHKMGGDPRVEKGRRLQAEAERKMQEDHEKEMAEFKAKHPDLWDRVQRRLAEMEKGAHNDSNILE